MKINFIFRNIHTIFCLIGLFCFSTGLFLINAPTGFIGTGIIFIILAIYIDRTTN
ncbi:hypothetical protein HMPREF9217_1224 [Lactobacillus iners LEAF 2052A-d]|nr:hypothetical protein HMPREF9217_1224 [Lactobacillus iners LEAF 2052A-d]